MSVQQYLASLPEDRRAAFDEVRDIILKNLARDYEEGMNYGVTGYYVPHRVYPGGHHCDPKQPLPFAGLGSQKCQMSLYLMYLRGESGASDSAAKHMHRFREAWAQTGKRPDMGKACIRFKKVEDLALDVIGEATRRVPAKAYIEYCEASLRKAKERPPARKQSARAPKSAASSGR